MPQPTRLVRALRFWTRAAPLAAVLLSAQTSAQGTLTGTVTDATGGAVVGAHVFVAGTTHATAAGADGQYTLALPAGTREVTFSMIGFATQTRRVSAAAGETVRLHVRLAEDARLLGELVVTADLDGRALRELNELRSQFRDAFLGTTRNRRDVEIANLDDVTLERAGPGRLRAVARRPLVVENRGLGYTITFHDLDLTARPDAWAWTSRPRFREMTPETDRQRRGWERARRETYRNSLRHFLASALAGRAAAEGFHVVQTRRVGITPRHNHAPMSDGELGDLVVSGPDGQPCLTFDGALAVGEPHRGAYRWSWIELKQRRFCDDGGDDLDQIAQYGVWAEFGAADLLPRDYRSPDAFSGYAPEIQ